MEKLSIEEKAKAYEMALERAKDYIEKQNPPVNILYEIFPELAESEDEKIRKFLIQMAQNIIQVVQNDHGGNKEWWDKCVAWLEKQGEQKKDTCKGCNNVKGCVTCVDGNNWTHYYYEDGQKIWSEEDEKMLDNLITYLDGRKNLLEEIKRAYIDWLKTLRPQNTWKS